MEFREKSVRRHWQELQKLNQTQSSVEDLMSLFEEGEEKLSAPQRFLHFANPNLTPKGDGKGAGSAQAEDAQIAVPASRVVKEIQTMLSDRPSSHHHFDRLPSPPWQRDYENFQTLIIFR